MGDINLTVGLLTEFQQKNIMLQYFKLLPIFNRKMSY